jgi:phage recombination protein Bet
MSNVVAVQKSEPRRSILQAMASRFEMEPAAFEATLRATVAKPDPKTGREISREEFAACLVVANEHGLNPLTKEIYFFPDKRGGIVPVVGIDGWARIINEHRQFDGMEFDTEFDQSGRPFSVECRIYRKDRSRPTTVVEFYSECNRDTDPWRKSPARMLRHKAMIQAARYAFGFSGLHDEDDADFIVNGAAPRDVTPARRPPPPPPSIAAPASSLPVNHQTVNTRRPPPPRSTAPYAEPAQTTAEAIDDGIPDHINEPEPAQTETWGDEPVHDQETGEVAEDDGMSAIERALLDEGRQIAMQGSRKLKFWFGKRTAAEMTFLDGHRAALEGAAQMADAKVGGE